MAKSKIIEVDSLEDALEMLCKNKKKIKAGKMPNLCIKVPVYGICLKICLC